MKLAFGIFIDLSNESGYPYTVDSTVGLAADGFRWITQATTSTTETYYPGILSKNWCTNPYKSVNLESGGNLASSGGFSVMIGNEIELPAYFEDESIDIIGKTIYLYEFDTNASDLGINANRTTHFVGEVEDIDYNRMQLTIKVKSPSRNANILTKISEQTALDDNDESIVNKESIGKNIPATFGEHSYAKLPRVANKQETILSGTNTTPNDLYSFPSYINENATLKQIILRFSNATETDITWLTDYVTEGVLYLKGVAGASSGEIRKVTQIQITGGNKLFVDYAESFEEDPVDNNADDENYDAENQSWFSFVRIYRDYRSDQWPGTSFLDDAGGDETLGPPIYIHDDGFDRAGQYILDIEGSDSNKISFTPDAYANNEDTISGYEVISPTSFSIDNSTDAEKWGIAAGTKTTEGVWYNGTAPTSIYTNGDSDDVKDRYSASFYQLGFRANMSITTYYEWVFNLSFPDLSNKEYDKAYLCVDIDLDCFSSDTIDVAFRCLGRSWIGPFTQFFEFSDMEVDSTNNVKIRSTPDFWYKDINPNVFKSVQNTAYRKTGRSQFVIEIENSSTLDYFDEFGLLFVIANNSGSTITNEITSNEIKQVSLVLEKTSDVKNQIFAPLKGRVWGTNPFYNSISMINKPVPLWVHVKLLQNWSGIGATAPTEGWGKAYSTLYSIKTDEDCIGSIDNQDLDAKSTLLLGADTARQIFDDKDGDTGELTKNICKSFFLMSWLNLEGKECLSQFTDKTLLTVSDSVDFSDIIPGTLSGVTELKKENVYSNISVSYGLQGNGEYSGVIKVTKTEKALTGSDITDAVEGDISDNQKGYLWGIGRLIYLKYGTTATPPKSMSENKWLISAQDAYYYLNEWQNLMGYDIANDAIVEKPKKYISFSVSWSKGRLWDVGTRINLTLKNETGENTRECLVTRFSKKLIDQNQTVTVTCLMYDY